MYLRIMAEFELDKMRVKASFDEAAERYDEVAVLQREVANRLLERLDLVKIRPRRVLDLGAGTGWCTRALAERYPKAAVVALDLAPGMLCRARGRFSAWTRRFGRHGFVCGDAERLPFADDSFDLIFSSLTLQWCTDPDGTFAELRRVLRPGGLLMFTTLGPDTLKELRASWAAVDNDVHVNTFLDMHDVGDAMVRARLADPVMDMEVVTVTYGKVPQLLSDLKILGAHNVNAGRSRGLTGKGRLKAMMGHYEQYRTEAGVLPATYEVIYGHAWGPEPQPERRGEGGEVHISLETLKSGLKR